MYLWFPLTCKCIYHCLCFRLYAVGDRAEGAEATLEASLTKLTLTVAEKDEGNSGDEQDPHYTNPDISSPSSATTLLLLNKVWWTSANLLPVLSFEPQTLWQKTWSRAATPDLTCLYIVYNFRWCHNNGAICSVFGHMRAAAGGMVSPCIISACY